MPKVVKVILKRHVRARASKKIGFLHMLLPIERLRNRGLVILVMMIDDDSVID